jgi:signal transduction histidine kinase/DNA-binding response OmpR family regulator
MFNALAISAIAAFLFIGALWSRLRGIANSFAERPDWFTPMALCIGIALFRSALAFVLYSGLLNVDQVRILFGLLLFTIAAHLPSILDSAAALLQHPRPRLSRIFWSISLPIGAGVALFGVVGIERRQPNWVSANYLDGHLSNLGALLTLLAVALYIAIAQALVRIEQTPSKGRRIIAWAVMLNIAVLIHDIAVVTQGLNNPYLSLFGMVIMAVALTLAAEGLADEQVIELTRLTHEAEARAEARTSFLSHMSHQVRTPLTEIRGLQYLLQDSAEGLRQAELAEALGTSAEILRTLIDDLLDYEAIDAGLLELDSTAFSPRQLHDDLQQFVELLPRSPELHLEFDYQGEAGLFLVGDAGRLRQVLLNLASNAIKFTARGLVRVRIRARSIQGKGELFVEIEDSGIGIAPGRHHSIFDSFSQGETGTSRRYQGSGLGLAISKRLSDLMDATLDFQSEPEEGTIFRLRVRLPIHRVEKREVVQDTGPGINAAALRGTRVLVVEDTPTNLLITRLLLEEMGCHVATAGDGIEALEILTTTAQHLVLMDLQMAPWDGFETTKRIRKGEDYEKLGHVGRIPIIAVTADVSPLARRQASDSGCDAFVAKPFTRTELMLALWRELPRIPQSAREHGGRPSIAPIQSSVLLQASQGRQGLAIERVEMFQHGLVELLHDLKTHQGEAALREHLRDTENLGLGEIRAALSDLLVAFEGGDEERWSSLLQAAWTAHQELQRQVLQMRQSFETAAYPQGKTHEFPDFTEGD